jgi:hypothetical protein
MSGWGVPFLWAGIWGAITVPWVRSVMHMERTKWEEEMDLMKSTMLPPPTTDGNMFEGRAAVENRV